MDVGDGRYALIYWHINSHIPEYNLSTLAGCVDALLVLRLSRELYTYVSTTWIVHTNSCTCIRNCAYFWREWNVFRFANLYSEATKLNRLSWLIFVTFNNKHPPLNLFYPTKIYLKCLSFLFYEIFRLWRR